MSKVNFGKKVMVKKRVIVKDPVLYLVNVMLLSLRILSLKVILRALLYMYCQNGSWFLKVWHGFWCFFVKKFNKNLSIQNMHDLGTERSCVDIFVTKLMNALCSKNCTNVHKRHFNQLCVCICGRFLSSYSTYCLKVTTREIMDVAFLPLFVKFSLTDRISRLNLGLLLSYLVWENSFYYA